jgi:glycosyltransferase involved in cell wall biosynthesis
MTLNKLDLTIIIPTKNRRMILGQLLQSIRQLTGIDRIFPEIIVADNNSRDDTYDHVAAIGPCFPARIRPMRALRDGKSAAINDAVEKSTGEALAFLDDDVIVDKGWLTAVEEFFQAGCHDAAQGAVRLQFSDREDAEVRRLNQRYRTIPVVDYDSSIKEVHSLNGSNFFVRRQAFDRAGGFDERLGPGASGTSEDVDFARRLRRRHMRIVTSRCPTRLPIIASTAAG